MSRETLISIAVLAWFVFLAMIEVLAERRSRPTRKAGADARLITNFGFAIITLLIGMVLPLASVAAAISGDGFRLALTKHIQIPWPAILALTLIGQTLAAYWVHRLMHQTPFLWRIHRVHHADTAVDVSSSLRNHPLELIIAVPVSALVVLVIGAPVSVVTASQSILIATAIWQHADISLPPKIDRALAIFIVTPRLHRLHHHPERAIHDSNFGELFTIWDRAFRTFCDREGREDVGLEYQVARPDHFVDQIWSPIIPASG